MARVCSLCVVCCACRLCCACVSLLCVACRSDDLEGLELCAPKLRMLGLRACYSLDRVRLLEDPPGTEPVPLTVSKRLVALLPVCPLLHHWLKLKFTGRTCALVERHRRLRGACVLTCTSYTAVSCVAQHIDDHPTPLLPCPPCLWQE